MRADLARPHRADGQVNGATVDLTSYEYKVLEYLMMHAGELVSKADLTEHIYQQDFDRDSNVLEVFIGRLRKKLDPDGRAQADRDRARARLPLRDRAHGVTPALVAALPEQPRLRPTHIARRARSYGAGFVGARSARDRRRGGHAATGRRRTGPR